MKIAIVGCGIVGAAIAYTLSQQTDWEISVWDRRPPDQWQATGAALGVLMAVLRTRLKGKHVRLGLESLQRYEALIPELEAQTNQTIPYNREGIVQLCFDPQDLSYWQKTKVMRHKQGFDLEILNRSQVLHRYPQLAEATLQNQACVGAIYSPQDRQVNPTRCTQALVHAAQRRGVTFCWQTPVQDFQSCAQQVTHIVTATQTHPIDAMVLTAGLGSTALTAKLQAPLDLQPVLGQAMQLRRAEPSPYPWPVVNGNDVHLVPLNERDLWVGATVEFPLEDAVSEPSPNPELLADVLHRAIALDPTLADAQVLQAWSGLRPRPQGQPAPVIKPLGEFKNAWLATGHYRNGVLLAPITAEKVLNLLLESQKTQ